MPVCVPTHSGRNSQPRMLVFILLPASCTCLSAIRLCTRSDFAGGVFQESEHVAGMAVSTWAVPIRSAYQMSEVASGVHVEHLDWLANNPRYTDFFFQVVFVATAMCRDMSRTSAVAERMKLLVIHCYSRVRYSTGCTCYPRLTWRFCRHPWGGRLFGCDLDPQRT